MFYSEMWATGFVDPHVRIIIFFFCCNEIFFFVHHDHTMPALPYWV
jgi:hypothetical protein